jgi:hypothetical protein
MRILIFYVHNSLTIAKKRKLHKLLKKSKFYLLVFIFDVEALKLSTVERNLKFKARKCEENAVEEILWFNMSENEGGRSC